MRKVYFLVILFACTGGVFLYLQLIGKSTARVSGIQPIVSPLAISVSPVSRDDKVITPQTLQIPKLGIDAVVESVGKDQTGKMDVPKHAKDVGWYSPGYKPGEKGNAVIDGHLDTVTGAPAVFYSLRKLQKGDKIIITGEKGKTLTFSVSETKTYPVDSFPIPTVFGKNGVPRLNLITCEGTFSNTTKTYSHRIVIYSELISS